LHSKATKTCKEEYLKLVEQFKRKFISKDIKSAHTIMTQLQMVKDALYEEIPVESEDFLF
jgi:hypothetical protein